MVLIALTLLITQLELTATALQEVHLIWHTAVQVYAYTHPSENDLDTRGRTGRSHLSRAPNI